MIELVLSPNKLIPVIADEAVSMDKGTGYSYIRFMIKGIKTAHLWGTFLHALAYDFQDMAS